MSKDKKRDEQPKKKVVTVEVEVALLGLLLSIVSLICLLNQGWLGHVLTFCLVYLFGTMYFVVCLFNIFFGLYLFFKKKKPSFTIGLNGAATIILLVSLLVACSEFDGASINNWYGYYKGNFNYAREGSIYIDMNKVATTGGGLFGYFLYALMSAFMGGFIAKLFVWLLILACLYVLLKKPCVYLYNRVRSLIIKLKEKKNNKNVNDEHIDAKQIIISSNLEENINKEINNVNKEIEIKKSEYSKNEVKEGLTFNIFTEKLFDDEDYVEEVKEEKVEDYVEEVIEQESISQNTDEFYVDESQIEFSEDGLEFFGDEEEVVEEKEAYIDESVRVIPTVKEMAPLDDVYSLLKENLENNAYNDLKDLVEINCDKINQKLAELNIKASVSDYIIGPCVTRYEIVPEIGVRVSSIVNIENDLKLALAAVKTRMEAPIPGKSAVGIEVANSKRYPVYLKEVLTPYIDDKSKLLVGIGRDLNNKEVVLNIDKMPHLLVAGATGSGKSVCINSMIVSLLLRTTPDEVKMILIDPKKVEMLPYANMPHLLCPVVIDPKKASVALKKVVKEMDKRYDMFANSGVRNIEGYNNLLASRGEPLLPNIVVVIDELADLMLVAAKEVEESIQRITQLARAAGIYLIVATQRPSVDVITGVIKANIPSRIAFAVSSQIDSRTIIDRGGAEELLGKGDMLMDISGSGALNRVQGVFVSDDEIFAVVNYVKNRYNVNFDEEFLNLEEEKKEEINNNLVVSEENNDDKLYEDIKDFVIRNQRASTSLLQRYFTLGYARAARMIDRLEMEGIISGASGAKPREVLVTYKKEEENNG